MSESTKEHAKESLMQMTRAQQTNRLVVRLSWFQAEQASIRSHLLSLEKNIWSSLKGHLPQFKSVIIIGKLKWFEARELRQ